MLPSSAIFSPNTPSATTSGGRSCSRPTYARVIYCPYCMVECPFRKKWTICHAPVQQTTNTSLAFQMMKVRRWLRALKGYMLRCIWWISSDCCVEHAAVSMETFESNIGSKMGMYAQCMINIVHISPLLDQDCLLHGCELNLQKDLKRFCNLRMLSYGIRSRQYSETRERCKHEEVCHTSNTAFYCRPISEKHYAYNASHFGHSKDQLPYNVIQEAENAWNFHLYIVIYIRISCNFVPAKRWL